MSPLTESEIQEALADIQGYDGTTAWRGVLTLFRELLRRTETQKELFVKVKGWHATALAMRDAAIALKQTGDARHYEAIEKMYMDAALCDRWSGTYRQENEAPDTYSPTDFYERGEDRYE